MQKPRLIDFDRVILGVGITIVLVSLILIGTGCGGMRPVGPDKSHYAKPKFE